MSDARARYEQAFARWAGVGHAFAFWKGRVAMYAILRGLGIGEGDEIILPGYTCVMDVNPIKYVGARPVYVDVEPVTYNLDVARLADAITPRTRLILAQHTYGYPCDMDTILDVAGRHGVEVVEDCCLAVGSRYKGRLCGTFGRAAYWSSQWNKPYTTGVGGIATTSDDALAGRIRELIEREACAPRTKEQLMLAIQRLVYRTTIFPRTTAMAQTLFRWLTKKGLVVGSSSTCEFQPTMEADFFKRMGPGQARAGLRQVRRLEGNIAHRRRMRQAYDELLRQAGWDVPALPEWMDPVLVRYPVRVADKRRAIDEAPGHGVEIGTWFECPLHPVETPMHLYDYRDGQCPAAEQACREVVNLPTHPRAGRKTAQRSVRFVQQIGPAGR